MRKVLLGLVGGILFQTALSAQTQHPPRCGVGKKHAEMIARHPEYAQKLRDQRASLQAIADFYQQYKAQGSHERTTAVSAVPIIFHIIVDSAQFNNLGGTTGIARRCDSQIAVLNHDFNRQNADSSLIPSGWKPLYGNSGITFGLARRDPSGNCSPGYEIKIIPGSTLTDAGYADASNEFSSAKTATTGLAPWDNTKYYNVWCVNFTDGSGTIGVTVNKSDVAGGWNASYEVGVVMLYNLLGSTGPTNLPPPGTGGWYIPFNLGRTMTHETGHFFEIWHPSGDDGGACPWSGGFDDGLSDTPPQADYTYNNPTYTGIPGGTIHDGCEFQGATEMQPVGIACLSYMDYTDDVAMHLFTTMEAAVMAGMVLVPPGSGGITSGTGTIGESYSLTQNPGLLIACPNGVASTIESRSGLSVYPNPASSEINISVDPSVEQLNDVVIMNMLGQQVKIVNGGKEYYSIDLSGMSKGIYFVKCNFASGSVTRKILLQ